MGLEKVGKIIFIGLGFAVLTYFVGFNTLNLHAKEVTLKVPELSREDSKGPSLQVGSAKGRETVEERPNFLYKVVSVDDWAKSRESVHLSSADDDFIHLSTEDQLSRIIKKYWAEVPEYVVLKIETAKLPGKLVLEANPGGISQYYHLYDGSIPIKSIVESKVLLNKQN